MTDIKKHSFLWMVVMGLALGGVACGDDDTVDTDGGIDTDGGLDTDSGVDIPETANVYIFHGAENAADVNVTVGDLDPLTGVAYKTLSSALTLPVGESFSVAIDTETTGVTDFSDNLQIPAAGDYLVVAYEEATDGDADFALNTALVALSATDGFVHAAAGVPANVSVGLKAASSGCSAALETVVFGNVALGGSATASAGDIAANTVLGVDADLATEDVTNEFEVGSAIADADNAYFVAAGESTLEVFAFTYNAAANTLSPVEELTDGVVTGYAIGACAN